jgi:hypothetical protein
MGMLLALLLALPPTHSLAAGGSSIATAPAVTYGQQEIGNTATGQYLEDSCGFLIGGHRSYWGLSVLAGDKVTINWEGTPGTHLDLMPVGTTDYTLFQTDPALYQDLSSNGKNQAQYTAPATGVMPLFFRVCTYSGEEPGPYAFIATVQHQLLTALTPIATIKRTSVITGATSLADGTPAPDGLLFHLVAKWHSGGQLVRAATSATTVSGALSFNLALPPAAAGKTVRLSISRAEDASYQATKSASINVGVTGAHRRHRHHRRRHHGRGHGR